MKQRKLSKQTRTNWLIDAALFAGAVLAGLSGVYFLFLPSGGYQGGRNPLYGVTILFNRSTWDDLHAWGGAAMIAAAVVHFAIHWKWVVAMTRRVAGELRGRGPSLNRRGHFNLLIDALVGLGFLGAAASGVYLLFTPHGRGAVDPAFLFDRATWDVIHTWSAVVMISAAVVHFAIHWGWVVKVTRNVLGWAWPRQPQTVAKS